jgi:hypothetical protein
MGRLELALYHVHFLDDGGDVFLTRELEHEDDETVVERARWLYVPRIGAVFDVWEGDRLVHRHRR